MTPSDRPPPRSIPARAALIHHEMVQLVALILVAVGAFFVTRTVAANNRGMNTRNAAEWFHRGEQYRNSGRIDEAINAFRRATVRSRDNQRYRLALAQALQLNGDREGARNILLSLRESAPEAVSVNLPLARLAAERGDVTETLRFYRDVLYAPWPADTSEARRRVRVELIRFLLTHDLADRAEPELLAASADVPDDVAHHLELARLFVEAGDSRNALAHFQQVLRLSPAHEDALAGAGEAAFQLGRYSLARTYLHETSTDSEAVRTTRDLVDLLLSRDPLAPRIGSRERRNRLTTNFAYTQQRFSSCVARRGESDTQLQAELEAFGRELKRPSSLDQDRIEAGVDLIDRAERSALQRCGPPNTIDRALLLIARQHGADSR